MEMPYKILLNIRNGDDPCRSIYKLWEEVYKGTREWEDDSWISDTKLILESLFYTFNMEHPEDYSHRSLSVGDVVVLGESAYLCAPVGWEEISLTEEMMVV